MTQKKAKPSASDLYESAWKALDDELRVKTTEEMRQEGWRTTSDFPSINPLTLKRKLLGNPKVEHQILRVKHGSRTREMNFYRLKL
jgi:hypothetical protein